LTLADLPCELFDGELQNVVSERWYHVRDRAIKWVDARVVRMVIATDVTERRQTEDENVRQQVRLEQTSRLISMGEMASTLAHELNQPFTAISNYAMGCVSQLESGKYRREDLLAAMQKASFQAERAGKIVRRMRDFVRKSEPNRASVPLAEIVAEAIGFAEIEARKAGVDIRVSIPAALPPVYADRIMIEQVLLNFLRNAREAMQHLAPAQRIAEIRTTRVDGSHAMVEVADRGVGISPEAARQLFSPFFSTKNDGMGMGLNICRSLIEYHEGNLTFVRNTDVGTTFRFTLPFAEDPP